MRITIAALLLTASCAFAQHAPPPDDCTNPEISATPTRPTVSFPAATTQCGVLEGEYGFARTWQGGAAANLLTSALRYGVTKNVELRWDLNHFATADAAGVTRYGIGDNFLLAKYRTNEQTKYLPAVAISYQIKLPTASPDKGLGTGFTDHIFSLLFSKDVGKFHFDQNTFFNRNGSATGYHENVLFTFAGAHDVTKKLQLTAEGWGQTAYLGNPAFASVLVGASYAISDRTVFDIAIDNGVTHFAPDHRFIIGVTRALVRVRGR